MAGRDLKHLARNFPDALAAVLWGLGIDAAAIQREVEASRGALIATTNSRSHLGTLNDFSLMLRWRLADIPTWIWWRRPSSSLTRRSGLCGR